jgi:hypothetical protein
MFKVDTKLITHAQNLIAAQVVTIRDQIVRYLNLPFPAPQTKLRVFGASALMPFLGVSSL